MQKEVYEELETVRQSNGGFLRPRDVVDFARKENTALHNYFTWDDDKAADEYRLAEARYLIRVCVVVHEQTSETVRAFVSLKDDRSPEGGYRSVVEVLDDDLLTEKMLNEAFDDLRRFEHKYKTLSNVSELKGVFTAINSIKRKAA